jgi:hypothetical protein
MTGEGEKAPEMVEELTINEMRIRVSGGPRRYVIALVTDAETWLVDHEVVLVQPDDVVGFRSDADAEHFLSQGRASDLGRWNNLDELRAAYEAQRKAQAPAAERAAKKGKHK